MSYFQYRFWLAEADRAARNTPLFGTIAEAQIYRWIRSDYLANAIGWASRK